MKRNLGNVDRIIRFVIAAAIAYLYYTEVISGTLGIALLVAAVIFALTSIFSFCPLYAIFGLSSCQTKKSEHIQ